MRIKQFITDFYNLDVPLNSQNSHLKKNVWWPVRKITILLLWLTRFIKRDFGFFFLHSGSWLPWEETLLAHASFETQERDHNPSRWWVVCQKTYILLLRVSSIARTRERVLGKRPQFSSFPRATRSLTFGFIPRGWHFCLRSWRTRDKIEGVWTEYYGILEGCFRSDTAST